MRSRSGWPVRAVSGKKWQVAAPKPMKVRRPILGSPRKGGVRQFGRLSQVFGKEPALHESVAISGEQGRHVSTASNPGRVFEPVQQPGAANAMSRIAQAASYMIRQASSWSYIAQPRMKSSTA